MSRLAFAQCGWTPTLASDAIDHRCFFPPAFTWPSVYVVTNGPGTYTADFDETFSFYWKRKLTRWDWNIGTPGTTTTPNGTDVNFHRITDEKFLVCGVRADTSFNSGAFNPLSCTISLSDYDADTQLFAFTPSTGALNVFQFDPAFGPLATTVVTIFGNVIPVYYDGVFSDPGGFVTASIPTSGAYWEYDNDKTATPEDGPIWDTNTGAQLITPIPRGL